MVDIREQARSGLKPTVGIMDCQWCRGSEIPILLDKKANAYAWCGHQDNDGQKCNTKTTFGHSITDNIIREYNANIKSSQSETVSQGNSESTDTLSVAKRGSSRFGFGKTNP